MAKGNKAEKRIGTQRGGNVKTEIGGMCLEARKHHEMPTAMRS